MRNPREKDPPETADAYYHLITRVVAGEFLLGDAEKEVMRRQIWLVAERCGIEVLTYVVMTNHVHVVVYAPKRVPLPDQELLRRYALVHSGGSDWEQRALDELQAMLDADGEEAAQWRAREMRLMCDISAYMKLLKQRFSIWYNKTHNRFGTLWAERFRSVQLEPGEVVARIAAYVDLNPIRAGLCRDPKDYRFCGYAEAVGGGGRARSGIRSALGAATWPEALRIYRMQLFIRAARPRRKGADITDGERDEVLAKQGALSLAEQLRCQCKYFTDGAVLGSQAFVLEKLQRFRRLTCRGEKMEPQPGSGAASGFAVLHKLRLRLANG